MAKTSLDLTPVRNPVMRRALEDIFETATGHDHDGTNSKSVSAGTPGDGTVTNAKLATDVKVGSLASLTTTATSSVQAAINELDAEIGVLSSLTTTAQSTVVAAINEVDSNCDTNATSIGTLASLTTTEKTNLVGAINEVNAENANMVTLTGTQTLTNKTLTTPVLDDGDAGCTITSADQTSASATITIPDCGDAADSFVLIDTSQTLTNKTLTTPTITTMLIDDGDAGCTLTSADQTNASATITIPDCGDAADNMVLEDTSQTLTNKTLTSPTITTMLIDDGDAGLTITSADQTNASPTATIPDIADAADTFCMVDTAQTLTNKTLTDPVLNLGDAVALNLGADPDVTLQWDGSNLLMTAAADDSLFEIGDSAATQLSFDLKWYANEANGASYLYADASENLIYTTDVDIQLKDNDVLAFGTGASKAGDVNVTHDGTNLIISAVADDTLIEIGDSAATQLSFDLKWYGDEANGASYLYADASENLIYTTGVDIQIKDNDVLVFGTGGGATGDIGITYDTDSLNIVPTAASDALEIGAAGNVLNTTLTGTLTVGVDDTGYDVGFFGATSGCSLLWDESEDQLLLTGPADVPVLKMAGAGSFCNTTTYAAEGAAWGDGGTPAFIADQRYGLIDWNGTVYRIPVWANA